MVCYLPSTYIHPDVSTSFLKYSKQKGDETLTGQQQQSRPRAIDQDGRCSEARTEAEEGAEAEGRRNDGAGQLQDEEASERMGGAEEAEGKFGEGSRKPKKRTEKGKGEEGEIDH